jgi:hypothetical protein
MIRVNLGFVVPSDGEFLSRDVASDRFTRHMWRGIAGMHRHPIKKPVSLTGKRAVLVVFANDCTVLSTWCCDYIASSW